MLQHYVQRDSQVADRPGRESALQQLRLPARDVLGRHRRAGITPNVAEH